LSSASTAACSSATRGQLDPFTIVGNRTLDRAATRPDTERRQRDAGAQPEHPPCTGCRCPGASRPPPAPTVNEAFYPFTGFTAGTDHGTRALEFDTAGFGSTDLDETLTMAFTTGWALHELKRRHVPRTDTETIQTAANLASRLLERGAVATCERNPDGRPLTARDIAIGVVHRDQADLVRTALTRTGHPDAPDVAVDTANRLQGREFEVVIVVHPLSGRRDATAFHLEAGRLCVLASRHRQACIVVAREGIADLLDSHPSTDPVHLSVRAKFPDGWEANQIMLDKLRPAPRRRMTSTGLHRCAYSGAERSGSFIFPKGICTLGVLQAVLVRWLTWSSKKIWGLRTSMIVLLSIPPRKKASLTVTPQSFRLRTARS